MPQRPVSYWAGASPVALGAILVQEDNGEELVICYVSRSLADVEKRYSQTEKEAPGIVEACESLHKYFFMELSLKC